MGTISVTENFNVFDAVELKFEIGKNIRKHKIVNGPFCLTEAASLLVSVFLDPFV